jgi:hypothetical protein
LPGPIQELCIKECNNGRLVALLALGFSSLQVLEWQWRDQDLNLDAFWDTLLSADTSKIRLQTLRLAYWPARKCDAMNSCIPKLVTLCGLHFTLLSIYDLEYMSSYQFLEAHQSFVKAVRKSARLVSASMDMSGMIAAFSGLLGKEAESRILNASLQRNVMLPQLLSRPQLDHLMQDGEDGTDVHLFPSLFAVAQQPPYGALNSIFAGLVTLSDALEPSELPVHK